MSSARLESMLKGKVGPAWMVLCDEPLLLTESRDRVRAAMQFDERRLFFVDADFDGDEALAEASAGNLFGDKVLLEFICFDALNATQAELLTQVAVAAAGNDRLVIVGSPRPRRAKWVDKLDDAFTVCRLESIPHGQFPGWIKARAKRIGLQMLPEAAEMLAGLTGGEPGIAAQELEKMLMVHGKDKTVTPDDVRASVVGQTRDDPFSLREAMAGGDCARAVRAVRNLKAAKETPVLVAWALAEEGKAVMNCQETGNAWGVYGKHLTDVKRIASRTSRIDIQEYLAATAQADWAAKGQVKTEPWLYFERLAAAFAMLARNNRLPSELLEA